LSKLNYRIHTDAVKAHLIPPEVTPAQAAITYAPEADQRLGLLALVFQDTAQRPDGDAGAGEQRQPKRQRRVHEGHRIQQHPQAAENEHPGNNESQFGNQEQSVAIHAPAWSQSEGGGKGNFI
jgi:hypothetical protein